MAVLLARAVAVAGHWTTELVTEPCISIVIPVLNEAGLVTKALQDLQVFRHQGHELIVVDGGSDDETATLAMPFCDQLLTSKPGRARQMNLGASSAVNGTLLFLHLDTQLPEGAIEKVVSALKNNIWGRFDVSLTGRQPVLKLVASAMNVRSRLTSVATGDQAIFVRRKFFEKICGFPVIPLMEDVAFSKKMRKLGRPACLKERVVCSSRRWERHGTLQTILLMWMLRLAYFAGVSPERLAATYYPKRLLKQTPEFPDTAVLMLARPPVLGEVKTRLAEKLGNEVALDAYTSLLFRQLSRVVATNLCHVQLWTTEFSPWFNQAGVPVRIQQGSELGEKMSFASREGLKKFSRVVLIGSDCPFLDQHYLEKALKEMSRNEVVIGPSADGGYVLLGLSKYIDEIFRAVPWSTSEVLAITLQKLQAQSVRLAVLPVTEDVDTQDDLVRAASAGFFITGQ